MDRRGIFLVTIMGVSLYMLHILSTQFPVIHTHITNNYLKQENITDTLAISPRSLKDSFGFLEYSDVQWKRMRSVHLAQSRRQRGVQSDSGRKFFQSNWEPTISCAMQQRIGPVGDGGKWVCDAYRIAQAEECNVVSIGSNNDWSFEIAVHKLNPVCKIFTFDHTITPHNKPPYVTFMKFGIGPTDTGQILTVSNALWKIGLHMKKVDIFKIDCEGCEKYIYPSFGQFDLRQILMEVHKSNWPVNSLFEGMLSAGYAIFHKEPNTMGCGGDCIEYGFLKLKHGFATNLQTIDTHR
jgi:hypothetical protein